MTQFNLKIDVKSISTGNGMMNKKAQIAEWFDAAKYPQIKYVSSKIEKSGDGYNVIGKLTIKMRVSCYFICILFDPLNNRLVKICCIFG